MIAIYVRYTFGIKIKFNIRQIGASNFRGIKIKFNLLQKGAYNFRISVAGSSNSTPFLQFWLANIEY